MENIFKTSRLCFHVLSQMQSDIFLMKMDCIRNQCKSFVHYHIQDLLCWSELGMQQSNFLGKLKVQILQFICERNADLCYKKATTKENNLHTTVNLSSKHEYLKIDIYRDIKFIRSILVRNCFDLMKSYWFY